MALKLSRVLSLAIDKIPQGGLIEIARCSRVTSLIVRMSLIPSLTSLWTIPVAFIDDVASIFYGQPFPECPTFPQNSLVMYESKAGTVTIRSEIQNLSHGPALRRFN